MCFTNINGLNVVFGFLHPLLSSSFTNKSLTPALKQSCKLGIFTFVWIWAYICSISDGNIEWGSAGGVTLEKGM